MSTNYIQLFTVAVYALSNNGRTRQLFAVGSQDLQNNLIAEAVRIGGRSQGDWYAVANVNAVRSLIRTTKDMGGIAYDLGII